MQIVQASYTYVHNVGIILLINYTLDILRVD